MTAAQKETSLLTGTFAWVQSEVYKMILLTYKKKKKLLS